MTNEDRHHNERNGKMPSTLFKIQIPSINGWADLKESQDGDDYRIVYYTTRREGVIAGDELQLEDFRVVPDYHEPDDDLY